MSCVPRWRPLAMDGALAVTVAAILIPTALVAPGAGALGPAAVLAGSLALVAWRRAPLVALPVTTVCMLVFSRYADPGPSAAFPVLVAVFGAVRAGHRLLAALAGAVYLGVGLAADLSAAPQDTQAITQSTTLLLGWFLTAGVSATVARHRQAYLKQVEERAAEAERTREEAALRRASEERLRIARELHDSLTHSISIIKVQAGVAIHLARKRGEEVPAALLAIQAAGGDAMRELRATLEVLRDAGDEPAASGLDRLDDLVERARSTGLPTTVTISGERPELPEEVDRAAYRIVQEALTNVSRHAGGASAAVRIDYGASELVVQVDDDGTAGPGTPPVPGVGLRGMRERVGALGGRLRAGPRPEGGFTVRAELPLGDAS
ncbi:sensor histidine kinase [Nonomuraea sp. KC401]|uniref:sensor histidine kinase n=1 Tax=unclassified Nonomuraea TaxID=2593643 RepID=UPI0010FF1C22|nr:MULTISPECIES: sensor histidine kinase [unclassified Nonomuraea]NBE96616.1 sensor histidine kinase [Nonomuraea sp. K271]TLF68354.1 sensor histidine kinase [Nonomuraea sp. KC401]